MGNSAALIDPRVSDNSGFTKGITFKGELIDFTQFTLMTAFSDGLNTIARYGFSKDNFIPTTALFGMDILTYGLMFYLADLRILKFNERHELFKDRNSQEYYDETARALLLALTEEEKISIKLADQPDQHQYIIDLIKHDARKICPYNLPSARTIIDRANNIFEQAKKRESYFTERYRFETKRTQLELELAEDEYEIYQTFLKKNLGKTFESMQDEFVKSVLVNYSDAPIEDRHIPLFIAELEHLEKSGNLKSEVDQCRLLAMYGVPRKDQKKALRLLAAFYDHYHSYHDCNDKAFYLGNLRGIREYELSRTRFKQNLFTIVKYAAAVATVYSVAATFLQAFIGLPNVSIYMSLFLVGSTSLVDEATDLRFKWQKLRQSQRDLKQWKAHPDNVNPNISPEKQREYKDLVDRVDRRQKKFFQACLSFTGVFVGVAVAMTIAVLTLSTSPQFALDILGFVSMGTVAVAFAGGAYMVNYQYHQNAKKADQAEAKRAQDISQITEKPRHKGLFHDYPNKSLKKRADAEVASSKSKDINYNIQEGYASPLLK